MTTGPTDVKVTTAAGGPDGMPLALKFNEGLGHTPRHPTLVECHDAGAYLMGKGYSEGGLPNAAEERARFEAYMRGHCWDVGKFDVATNSYDTVHVRCLYGVWRDRGSLPALGEETTSQGRLLVRPNVRAEAGPTAKRQARVVENAPAHCAGLAF